MRLAVVESNDLLGELLTFAARRRKASVHSVAHAQDLQSALPFRPRVVAVVQPSGTQPALPDIHLIRDALPSARLVVIADETEPAMRISLLKAGVGDILTRPFDPLEIVLKLEGLATHDADDEDGEPVVEVGDLVVDAQRYRAVKNGQTLRMTPLELRVLYCLAAHSPSLTPAERLLSFGWGSLDDPDTSLIRTHVCHLRRKLEAAGGVHLQIKSNHTLGYTMTIAGSSEPAQPATGA